ncbi:MAG: fructose-1,6-bisphosphatase, partial [Bdellovibrionales bacterium]|nr:fructose-1,6-bisphosphatase [Bdellovibrionales bacterium]
IFSIFKKLASNTGPASEKDFFQAGKELVAAGYAVYGSSTVFVYSAGEGVHEFTLDPTIGEFLLTNENIVLPEKSGIYSINEGNTHNWGEEIKAYVEALKFGGEGVERPYSARYIGSLVADFHRNLKKGGVFLYPADKKNQRGKLRLLYECIPMAFIAEQAGGRAIDGKRDILEIVPTGIHERCPLIVGNKADIALFERIAAKV